MHLEARANRGRRVSTGVVPRTMLRRTISACIIVLFSRSILATDDQGCSPSDLHHDSGQTQRRDTETASGGAGNLSPASRSSALEAWRRTRAASRRPCGPGEHAQGSWVERDVVKRVPCCGWDGNHFLQDPEHCGEVEMPCRWNEGEGCIFFTGREDVLAHMGGLGCCAGWEDRYEWEPAGCFLEAWDAPRFCEALGARTLLFVGDSTMLQAQSPSHQPSEVAQIVLWT
ncbi:hypothetical protein T484DRAFT_2579588 [Baffinella frigidus]|nr:hypothetical protein T484DRAFT_2579588 [Cryptophyta sp. CCMP2293]